MPSHTVSTSHSAYSQPQGDNYYTGKDMYNRNVNNSPQTYICTRVKLTFFRHELIPNNIIEFLHTLIVFWFVEKNKKRDSLFRQFFSVLERNLPDQRHTLLSYPRTQLIIGIQASCECLIPLIGASLVSTEYYNRLAWWMHRRTYRSIAIQITNIILKHIPRCLQLTQL